MKNLKRIKSILLSPFTLGLLITLVMTYIAVDYYAHIDEDFPRDDRSLRGLIHQIHEKTIDWRMLNRGIAKGSDRIAILAIDDNSIHLEGRWPWPREKMAKLIDRTVMTYGAKLISFDMTFSEPDNSSALPTLNRLVDETKTSTDPNLKGLLTTEIAKADADKILANSINAASDNLILGGFSSEGGNFEPVQDICVETHFERSYAGRYWSSELLKPTVIDETLNTLKYPKDAITANLKTYFSALENTYAASWFIENPDALARVQKALTTAGITLDPNLIPGLMIDNINNDFATAHQELSEHPELANNDAIQGLFLIFNHALKEKEVATLKTNIFSSGLEYCHRFFTAKDELRDLKNFRASNSNLDPEAAKQLFDGVSWATMWAQVDKTASSEKEIERLRKEMPAILIPEMDQWEVNIPVIDDAKSNSGYFDAILDNDGTIRRNALLRRDGFSYEPSIAFKTFLVDQKLAAQATVGMENVGKENSLGRIFKKLDLLDKDGNSVLTVPVDKKGYLQVNYAGPSYMFPHVSATDILSDGKTMMVTEQLHDAKTGRWEARTHQVDKAEFMKGKILFLGATAVGVYDLRVTPFEENYPGVETHANALSNLLIETARARHENVPKEAPGFLRRSPLEETTMWIYLLVGGIALSALLNYFGSGGGVVIMAVFLAAIYYVDNYILFSRGIIIMSIFPVTLTLANFVGLTSFKYFTEERKKRELKETFSKYVSPSIVNEVLADPENIELGGKKMELTVMFSDVRGFTTISEKLDPRALSDLLNSYLTPMTNLVFAHKGTLDKYMGDAIMAFWGAPVNFKDHAKHACRCALEMLVKLHQLQAEYRAKGLPEIDIGIGLNTGEMSVGNMGSDTVRSYTVMGDAVNLGSRLEGINKQYGTRIIISEFTYAAVKDAFICREIDWVKVKGKTAPVRIFELVAEGSLTSKGFVQTPKQNVLALFAEGFGLYHEQKFKEASERFTNALSFDANDAPSQLYVERCQDYLTEPPPPEWDGVFTMTSK